MNNAIYVMGVMATVASGLGIKSTSNAFSSAIISEPPLAVENLPTDIVRIGVQAFGSLEGLTEALHKTHEVVQVDFAGVNMKMLYHSTDNTLKRLKREMHGDRYGIRKVSAKQGVIVDIGSNIGDVAVSAALLHPTLQIVAVEPAPPTYFYLCLNLWLNNVSTLREQDLGKHERAGVLALNAAVTKDGRSVDIKWDISNTQNAVIDTKEDSTRTWNIATVPSLRVADLFSRYGVVSIELFKIDCEGCEYEVIPSMLNLFLDKSKVKRVVGEIHQSLKSPKEVTNARHATGVEMMSMDAALALRGCAVGQWFVEC